MLSFVAGHEEMLQVIGREVVVRQVDVPKQISDGIEVVRAGVIVIRWSGTGLRTSRFSSNGAPLLSRDAAENAQ